MKYFDSVFTNKIAIFWGQASWCYISLASSWNFYHSVRNMQDPYKHLLKYLGAKLDWMASKFGWELFSWPIMLSSFRSQLRCPFLRKLFLYHRTALRAPLVSSHVTLSLCLSQCILISRWLVSLPYWVVSSINEETVLCHFGIHSVQNRFYSIVGT